VPRPASAASGLLVPSDGEFQRFRSLIERETGIFLADHKKVILAGRLNKRLRELGMSSFRSYYEHVASRCDDELIQLIDCISNNQTRFFREPEHFEILRDRIFPEFEAAAAAGRMPRRLRVWSAGCSTGEEPHTLAMVLLSSFPPGSGWNLEILASDISTRALGCARAGLWPIERSEDIPQTYLKRFMLRGTGSQKGRMKARPELQRIIQFERINLIDETCRVPGSFDLIFCRNVLIYFEMETKRRVIERLFGQLSPHGYLFLGHAESLAGMGKIAECVAATVYRRRDAPPLLRSGRR